MELSALPCYVPGLRDGLNLRDLGGWRGDGSRPIRKQVLYRGARLAELSAQELEVVESLGLHTVVDLRSKEEAVRRPDPVLPGVCHIHADAGREDLDASAMADATFEEIVEAKVSLSVAMAFGSSALKTLFSLLLEANSVPLLFHCNSGKDRTGVAAIALLLALGCNERTIMADYLLSNAYRKREIAWSFEQVGGIERLGEHYRGLFTIMQGVIPETCQAILDAIDARYPTRDAYLEGECGLDAEGIAELRHRYLA